MVSVQDAGSQAATGGRDTRRPRRPAVAAAVVGVLLLVAAGVAVGVAATAGGPPGPPAASVGTSFDRAVPASVSSIPLVDQQGRATDLAALRGRVVVLVPFLTSCQEVCPITTGVLLQVQRSLAASGVTGKVAVVEASVDPGRDTPARLAAYAHLTGARWPLLTAGAPSSDALWAFFGVEHNVVPEGSPPGIDWESGRPYTYDVDHGDGFVLLDARGHERFSTGGMPHTAAPLSPALRSMLDDQGRANLASSGPGSWNASDVVDGVGWLLGAKPSGGT
jgi:protein SCO1/2